MNTSLFQSHILARLLVFSFVAGAVHADEADAFFDDSEVREIRIWFEDPDWYQILFDSHADDPLDPYFECRFEYEDFVLEPCGVRMKGHSSFGSFFEKKKSFKFDFNEFDDDARFLGLKKLNMNNAHRDPTMMRDKLFYELLAPHESTALRVVHCRLYINDEYWGLYSAIEQVDKTLVQSRFGGGEDGNLFKCENSGVSNGFGSNLQWMSTVPEDYQEWYELKTNESDFDYTQLAEFIDVLNNQPIESRSEMLEQIANVDQMLMSVAWNCLLVNIDAYNGSAHNYYVYDRDDTGLFQHIFWDVNESFGTFRYPFDTDSEDIREMPALWAPQGAAFRRPMMTKLWEIETYQRAYLRHLARFMRTGFDAESIGARAHEIADLIRDDVYADTKKRTRNDEFEIGLDEDQVIQMGETLIYGLRAFVEDRTNYLDTHLDGYAEPTDLQFNELVSVNASGITDEQGDSDPWLEIYNLGPGLVQTDELFVSDQPGDLAPWRLPPGSLDDGEFLVLWMDGEIGEGASHAAFALDPKGGTLYFSIAVDGGGFDEFEQVTYPALDTDQAWGRSTERSADWVLNAEPTPGAPNVDALPGLEGVLVINEFMADNDTTIADEAGDYEDWIELYNAGDTTIDLGGLHMSDDLLEPMQWEIPDGVTLVAGGHLLIWADSDADEGPLHADFKLGGGGEEIGLFARDGSTLIDSIVFGEQVTDVSFGRYPDAGESWQSMSIPTPGTTNVPDPPEVPVLFVNEVMSDNDGTIADQAGEFEDWVEIYNPGKEDIDFGGLYLTDDPREPDAWQAPAGLVVPAGGFLLIWADNDLDQGDDHAGFKLSSGGEQIVLLASDALTVIDSFSFGEIGTDRSYGRATDGGTTFTVFDVPTPGVSNEKSGTGCIADFNGDGTVGGDDLAALLGAWGSDSPDYDFNGDGTIGGYDLSFFLSHWGPC